MATHFVITEDNHLISLNDVHSSLHDEIKHDFEVTMKDGNIVRVKNMPWSTSYFDSLITP